MEFHPGDGHNKRRMAALDLSVWHWTGSENALETMFRVLMKRKLGVEFAISPYGSLYQFCDPTKVDTADAGIANARSWGVEMVNAGIRRRSTLWREPRYRKIKMGPRDKYDCRIHGKKVRVWNFYTAQIITAFALNRLMSDVVGTYPANVATAPTVLDVKAKTNGDRHTFDRHIVQGAVGHYNVSRRKLDPGPLFMAQLSHYMKTGDVSAALDVKLAV